MRRFLFGWYLAAVVAGLGVVGAIAPQMFGVETRPSKEPAADQAQSEDQRVAERIALDPSIRETPSLPTESRTPARAHITDADPVDSETPASETQLADENTAKPPDENTAKPDTRFKAIPEPAAV
jgi:hypothetical protein